MNNAKHQGLGGDTRFLNLVAMIANWDINCHSMKKYIKMSTKAMLRTDGVVFGEVENYTMDNGNFHTNLNYLQLNLADLHHTYWCSFTSLLKLLMKTDISYGVKELRSYNSSHYYRITVFFKDFYNIEKVSSPNAVVSFLRLHYNFSSSYDYQYWTILWLSLIHISEPTRPY